LHGVVVSGPTGRDRKNIARRLPARSPSLIPMRNKTFGDRIADVLIEDGLLLPNQLEEATAIQKEKGGRLLKILTDKQFVTDQDIAFSMGSCLYVKPIIQVWLRIYDV